MLKTRLLIAALLSLVLVAVVTSIGVGWLPPSVSRFAVDSYSGRWPGHRALVELLQATGTTWRRNLSTPDDLYRGYARVLLVKPDIHRLELEKGYLHRMQRWVRAGGELVVVSDVTGVLAHVGLQGLAVARSSVQDQKAGDETGLPVVEKAGGFPPRPAKPYSARAGGSLAHLNDVVRRLSLPKLAPAHFSGPAVAEARGAVEVAVAPQQWNPLVLEFASGSGSMTLVADLGPFTNLGMGQEDNAVLAYHLAIGTSGREVVVDEYYHGIVPQGTWLALMTIPWFGVTALSVLVAVLIWAWHSGMRFGPPTADKTPSRRSILEYVEAMARLFLRGGKHHFALQTCREGLVGDLQTEFFLAAGTSERSVLKRLAQLDTKRHHEVRSVLDAVDRRLADPRRMSSSTLVQLQQRLDACRMSAAVTREQGTRRRERG